MGANKNVYQIKISLKYIKPMVWRRFLVEDSIKLPDLHQVIQTVEKWHTVAHTRFSNNGIHHSFFSIA